MLKNLFKIDPTKKEVRNLEDFFGYKKTKPIKYNSDFIRLKEELEKSPEVREYNSIRYTSTSVPEVRKAYDLWDFLGIKMQELEMIDIKGELEGTMLLTELAKHASMVPPDKLPVSCRLMDICDGGAIFYYFTNPLSGDKYVLFQEIVVPPFGNLITGCVYAHEVSHTQMTISGGIGNDMLNVETIPMLMEQIAAFYNDPTGETLRHLRYFRLANIIYYLDTLANKDLPFKDKIDNDAWIKSTIQAVKFANIFFASSEGTRREMLNYINNLFNGSRNLDEMLAFYGIDFRECDFSSLELKRIR